MCNVSCTCPYTFLVYIYVFTCIVCVYVLCLKGHSVVSCAPVLPPIPRNCRQPERFSSKEMGHMVSVVARFLWICANVLSLRLQLGLGFQCSVQIVHLSRRDLGLGFKCLAKVLNCRDMTLVWVPLPGIDLGLDFQCLAKAFHFQDLTLVGAFSTREHYP